MKNITKNQCKKFPLWGMRGLLAVALSSLSVVAFAQSVDVCAGTSYTIASTVDASGASTYQWLENGSIIPNTSAPTYIVPNNKAAGLYTYIRQSKSADCSEWQSSNVFTVTVYACSFTAGTATSATATFTDPRDGKRYKTVVMPDGKTWFAQNLNYTKDLTYNAYAYEANGKPTLTPDGSVAIGSYWCPAVHESVVSGTEADCRTLGALYTWETAMMVDGKYADETKTSSAWDESWVSPFYFATGAPNSNPNADRNNARGAVSAKQGGRGICPVGWHIPTVFEWATMLDAVVGSSSYTSYYPGNYVTYSVYNLLSASTFTNTDPGDGSWLDHADVSHGDQYNFSAVPAGERDNIGSGFIGRGTLALYNTSVPASSHQIIDVNLSHNGVLYLNRHVRGHAKTVRCIKD